MTTLSVRTSRRQEMIDVTERVRRVVADAKLQEGLVCVFSPHTTAGVTIQENADPDVKSDLLAHLAELVPQAEKFKHSEGNADSHIKTSVVGSSATVIVDGGDLRLGRWQAIYLCEFDGPRARELWIKIIGNRT